MHQAGTRTAARWLRQGGAACGLLLLLGACSSPDRGFVEGAWAPFSGSQNIVTSDALTVQRVRGEAPAVQPLLPEPGNVWPEQEAPRPTLLSGPEEAFRNIPEYRPQLIEGAPPARSPVPTPAPGARLGSGAAPPPPPLRDPQRFGVAPPPASPGAPQRPAEGQVLIDPQGRPAVTTGQAGRVTGFTQPGVGGGAVVRDGNVETWIGPDGRSQSRIVPH
jgi:hypothetical protein